MNRRGFLGLLGGALAAAAAIPFKVKASTSPVQYGPSIIEYYRKEYYLNERVRKLKAHWTTEAAEDLKVIHGVNCSCCSDIRLFKRMAFPLVRRIYPQL